MWPGYSWILGSLNSNVGCPYLFHMVGETDFRKHDELLFSFLQRNGFRGLKDWASYSWGRSQWWRGRGPLYGPSRLCGREQGGLVSTVGTTCVGTGSWTWRCVVEAALPPTLLRDLSDGNGRCWTQSFMICCFDVMCVPISLFLFFSLLFPHCDNGSSKQASRLGFKKAAQIMLSGLRSKICLLAQMWCS